MSIPRFVKTKPNFPQPGKVAGKNAWFEDVADAYVESEMAGGMAVEYRHEPT
jgi:hypothetical protein